MIEQLKTILLRDLATLHDEIEAFADEEALWRPLPGTTNPPGALALHICGNLQHFIGATLGGSGYVRDRDAEFASRGLRRDSVLGVLLRAREVVDATLSTLDVSSHATYPIEFLGEKRSIGWVLVHLSGHLMYHLGQINYARRGRTG